MVFPPTRSFSSYQAASDALTYEPFFGLTEKPFSLNADLRFLFDSPSHAESLKALLDGIRRREGFVVLTGEIGTGKTMLCRAALRRLGKKTFSSFVPDPFSSREDLLKTLLIDFGVISIGDLTSGTLKGLSRTELSYLLSGFLESIAPLDTYVVVIIDEAQNLAGPMIEETRILGDSFGGSARLQVVFVGQMELHDRLKAPEMRQVDQRITSYTRLTPLTAETVGGYIRHRLVVAGHAGERELFPQEIVEIIHRRTGGVPRLINRVCDHALAAAFERQSAVVDRASLDAALESIGATTFTPTWLSIVADSSQEATPAMPIELPAYDTSGEGQFVLLSQPENGNITAFPSVPTERVPEDDFLAQLDAEWAARTANEEETSWLREGVEQIDLDAAPPVFETPAPPPAADAHAPEVDTAAESPAASDERAPVESVPALDAHFSTEAAPAADAKPDFYAQPAPAVETPAAPVPVSARVLTNMAPAPLARRTSASQHLFRGERDTASEPQSVWSKRVGIIVAILAAVGIVVFGVAQLRSYFGRSAQPAEEVSAVEPPPPAPQPAPASAPAAGGPSSPAVVAPAANNAGPVAPAEYYVAVGLYLSEAYANSVIDKLTVAVLPAKRRSVIVRGQAYEQVVVGPFKTRDDATAALARLQELSGYDDARVIELTPEPAAS
jgi:type II secretory pathway predicted ATPase ExeA/cell division protein FtsN